MEFDKNNPFFGMAHTEGMQLNKAFETLEPNITYDWMAEAIVAYFISQKHFAEFIGVGSSTVTNWGKERSFPEHVKRLLVYTLLGKLNERSAKEKTSKLTKALQDSSRPLVFKDGSTYSILCTANADDNTRNMPRKIIAQHIPEFQIALSMAGSEEAWSFLEQLKDFIFSEIPERVREVCETFEVDDEATENIVEAILRPGFPLRIEYNALTKRWTDPEKLEQINQSILNELENIDWGDAFEKLKKNSVGE